MINNGAFALAVAWSIVLVSCRQQPPPDPVFAEVEAIYDEGVFVNLFGSVYVFPDERRALRQDTKSAYMVADEDFRQLFLQEQSSGATKCEGIRLTYTAKIQYDLSEQFIPKLYDIRVSDTADSKDEEFISCPMNLKARDLKQ